MKKKSPTAWPFIQAVRRLKFSHLDIPPNIVSLNVFITVYQKPLCHLFFVYSKKHWCVAMCSLCLCNAPSRKHDIKNCAVLRDKCQEKYNCRTCTIWKFMYILQCIHVQRLPNICQMPPYGGVIGVINFFN